MKAKRLLQKAALALLGVVLPALGLEFGYRLYDRLTLQDWVFTYDRTLGWKLVPGARRVFKLEEAPYLIEINSDGFRDRERSFDKPPSISRIVVIGDSFVFGSGGVEQQDRFTDLLEKSSANLEVLNLGVPGYSTDQEYLVLKTKGLRYKPDLVLFCLFENDFEESFVEFNRSINRPKGYFFTRNGTLEFRAPSLPYTYTLSHQSHLFGLALREARKLGIRRGPARGSEQPKFYGEKVLGEEERQTFQLLLVSARDLCKKTGAEFVLVYFPSKEQQQRNIVQESMSELATREGLKSLDLTDLSRQAHAERPIFFKRDAHFTRYGHQVIAQALREFLVKNGFLTSPSQGSEHRAMSPPGSSPVPRAAE